MKYNIAKPEEVFKAANIATRKRHFKLWIATQILVRKKHRGFIYLLHMYLRWADDIIDDPRNSVSIKRNFMLRQRDLMSRILKDEGLNLIAEEENYLLYFIKYLIKINKLEFIRYLENTFKTFEMDIDRLQNEGMFSESAMSEYLALLNEAIFRISFLFIPMGKKLGDVNGFIGIFFWHVLTIRDFREDINAGLINITKEDIKRYNLDSRNLLDDSQRFVWLRETYPKILGLLDEELGIMNKMPFFVKIVWVPSYFNLIGEFNRVKFYDFKFGVRIKKELIKEIKTHFVTARMGIKLFIRVFF